MLNQVQKHDTEIKGIQFLITYYGKWSESACFCHPEGNTRLHIGEELLRMNMGNGKGRGG